MAATVEYYEQLSEALPDTESLTVLVVAGAARDAVASALEVDLTKPIGHPWDEGGSDHSAWALMDIPGGVLAMELTGYGDPTRAALRAMSANGGVAAVVRHNIQAHLRFGCARDGELLFDDDEFMYIEDPGVVPDELRPLFDLVWDDLEEEKDDEDDEDDEDLPDGFVVGLAMAELITGLELTAEQVAAADRSGYFKAPSLVYATSPDN